MKVSVCIATYNGEKYIVEQLTSILDQIGHDDEVIVSDDHSSDRTVEFINSLDDHRVRVILNNGEKGYTSNFENALVKCTGDIIFLSDQDDVWLPGKYDDVVKHLERYDLVVTNSKVTDENLNVTHDSFFALYHSRKGIMKNLINNTYYGSCMAFRKSVLNNALPFPKDRKVGFDIWIGLVAEITGKVFFLPEPYLLYRKSEASVTVVGSNLLTRSNNPLSEKILKRLITIYYFSVFYLKYKFGKKRQ